MPGEFRQRENACYGEWRAMSETKRMAILDELSRAHINQTQPEHWKDNPLFYLRDFPELEPTNYNGARTLPDEPLVIAIYHEVGGIYTQREAKAYGMQIVKPFTLNA